MVLWRLHQVLEVCQFVCKLAITFLARWVLLAQHEVGIEGPLGGKPHVT